MGTAAVQLNLQTKSSLSPNILNHPVASGAEGCMQAHTGEAHLEFMTQTLGRGALRVRVGGATRTVAWSPSGAAAAGGCLLCVVSEAHKVSLAHSPDGWRLQSPSSLHCPQAEDSLCSTGVS